MNHRTLVLLACIVVFIPSLACAQEPATQPTTIAASQPVNLDPSLVTLKLDSPEPWPAFSAFAQQAKLTLDEHTQFLLKQDHTRLPDINLAQLGLWDALRALTETSGFAFQSVNRDGVLTLAEAPAGLVHQPTSTNGPFMVTISHIDVNLAKSLAFPGRTPMNINTNRFAAPPCRIYLDASAEPRLNAIRWSIDSLECISDDGKALLPMRESSTGVLSSDVNSPSDTQLRFDSSFEGVKLISTLRLTTRFYLERSRQTLQIDNPLEVHDKTYSLGGFRVHFSGLTRQAGNRYSYVISAFRDDKDRDAWELFRSTFNTRALKILDAQGNSLQMAGGGGMYSADKLENTTTLTGAASPPVKLVWTIPTEIQQVPITFEFKNVPLP